MSRRNSLGRHYVLRLLLCVCACIMVGCEPGCKNDAQERIDKTVQEVEAQASKLVLAELRRATPESLQQPRVVFAHLVEQRRTVVMLIKWIEATPTVNGVCIRCSETEPWRVYPIAEWELAEARKVAKRGFVLFNAGAFWEPESESWDALAPKVRAGMCEAALSRDGQVVSNIVPIKYFPGSTLFASPE